ncbi:MAG: hypothetical protein JSU86_13710, partial [Phycisphaerales bacterium]
AYTPAQIARTCVTNGMKKSRPETNATIEAARVTGPTGSVTVGGGGAPAGRPAVGVAVVGGTGSRPAFGPSGGGRSVGAPGRGAVTRSPQFPHFADWPGSTSTTCRQLGQVSSTDEPFTQNEAQLQRPGE